MLGASASGLCLVHCAATPFLFIAQACSVHGCAHTPVWWQSIDYIFLGISFFAIFYATRNSSKNWVKMALWGSWAILLITLLDEALGFGILFESFIYVPAIAIVGLHLYNQRYCQCADDSCSTT